MQEQAAKPAPGLSRALLDAKTVQRALGTSHSPLYDRISRGMMTPGIALSTRTDGRPAKVVWPSDEIEKIIAAKIAGATDEELRELVSKLLAERKSSSPEVTALRAQNNAAKRDYSYLAGENF
jgi:prophage regulatory protein